MITRRSFLAVSALCSFSLKVTPPKRQPEMLYPQLMWGTYGKEGNQPLRWVQLDNCSDEHLQAILDTQQLVERGIGHYEEAIKHILKHRRQHDIVIEDTA